MTRKRLAAVLQQSLLLILLMSSCLAFATDTDGDGVDDSTDAFPTDLCATTDTDTDGMPDKIVNCMADPGDTISHPSGAITTRERTIELTTPQTLAFKFDCYAATNAAAAAFLIVDGSGSGYGLSNYANCLGSGINLSSYSISLTTGVHRFKWQVWYASLTVAEVTIGAPTTLTTDPDDDNDGTNDSSDAFPLDPTEQFDNDLDGTGNNADLDDDGDGVPDYIDAAPLNGSIANERVLPLNSGFKGSVIRDREAVQ